VSVATVDLRELRQLLARSVQLVEVLPREEYEDVHLPGAINIPLKQLDARGAERLDRDEDVVVYCWDGLCDLSPRAAARLDALGFAHVYDYAAGKVDWLAHALPAEGITATRPNAGSLAQRDMAICSLASSAAEVRRAIAESPYGFALVLDTRGVLLGRVRQSSLDDLADLEPIGAVVEPGPSTIRPQLPPDELRRRLEDPKVRALVVTHPDGTLVGILTRDQLDATRASAGEAASTGGQSQAGESRQFHSDDCAMAMPEYEQEVSAAAREAAQIGGTAADGGADPAQVPVSEAGGGEAEGFEQAEQLLIEHASHADQQPAHTALHHQGRPEQPDAAEEEHGEADRARSSERADGDY
jgi:rhodanese-related sulfurtransferase/CBS domain-containing protein